VEAAVPGVADILGNTLAHQATQSSVS
jgi:hypothetical protein